ncbi:MAG: methyltransferase domain-containing protein [Bdellovibrio sp.]|nr:methyltransferase domain-containing protein [Bdellovibrio sp.]
MQMREYVTKYDSLAAEDTLFNIPHRKEYLLSRIGKGKRVLDVGCLGGRISKVIQDQNNEVWGVEVNANAAAVAEKRGIQVKVANVEDGLPFENSSFDVVNAGEVVEHLYDTKFFFQESHRVLKEGGILIFTTPNLNSIENRIRILLGGYPSMIGAYPEDHFGDHVRIFNLEKIEELCFQTGFKVEDVSGAPGLYEAGHGLDKPLGWMSKLLPRWSKLLMVTARRI